MREVGQQEETVERGDLALTAGDPQVTPGTVLSQEISDLPSIQTSATHYWLGSDLICNYNFFFILKNLNEKKILVRARFDLSMLTQRDQVLRSNCKINRTVVQLTVSRFGLVKEPPVSYCTEISQHFTG